jgi:hypothetical protein
VSSDFTFEIMVPLIWQTGILGNPDDRLPTGEFCQAVVIGARADIWKGKLLFSTWTSITKTHRYCLSYSG